MNIKEFRTKKWYSQDKMWELLWISRLTYNSREKWESEWKNKELIKLRQIFSDDNDISTKADKIISYHNTITVYDIELILETLEDKWLLNDEWILIRNNIRRRFIAE